MPWSLRTIRKAAACAAACAVLAWPGTIVAQPAGGPPALVVENDVGGDLRTRVVAVAALRASGRQVQVRGAVCYSTCTLYLGLPGTCVSPDTIFGFHGPSSHGRALAPQQFEQASQVIVSHYPPVLQDWYMTVARHELRGLLKVSGRKLSRIGAARLCPDAA